MSPRVFAFPPFRRNRFVDLSPDFAPIAISEIELSEPLTSIPPANSSGRNYAAARVLVRLHTRPLGQVELPVRRHGVTASELGSAIWRHLGDKVNEHLDSE